MKMMMIKKKNIQTGMALIATLVMTLAGGCKKSYLDARADKALLVPTTVSDLQALLDNMSVMNTQPSLNLIAAEEFFTTDAGLPTINGYQANAYLWKAGDIYEGPRALDWEYPYRQIFYANVVLEGSEKLEAGVRPQADMLRGSALFYRAFGHFNLAQSFAKHYQAGVNDNDPGIPLRLNSDVNNISVRATLRETYARILNDLLEAEALLPLRATVKSRPSKPAAWGLLARIQLVLGNFDQAGRWADTYLKNNSELLDYNTLTSTGSVPFPQAVPAGNPEVIFYSSPEFLIYFYSALTYIEPTLYNTFQDNDLRKQLLFSSPTGGNRNFIGYYSGIIWTNFGGIATDEVLLIRAECYARQANTINALADLNLLREKRWKRGMFTPVAAANADETLVMVLAERRKELIARGLRWSDLRRLNIDPRFAVTLQRTSGGRTYTLPPNDPRYVFPIPSNEITISGIPQNER